MIGVENMENIIVHNAFENNLKNITVKIPLNKFTCITGPSGCGKSSLLFDTIYAESQRSFMESLSGNMYGQKLMDKPKVDSIDNLRPALNISQTYYNVNPRSTVGTVTDISYYLRTLFAFIVNQENNTNLDMNNFSSNNPSSWCTHCHGLGEEYVISEQAVVPDKNKSLAKGGILYYKGAKNSQEFRLLEAICEYYNIDINAKIQDLTEQEKYNLLYRKEPHTFHIKYKTPKGRYKQSDIVARGALVELKENLKKIDIPSTFSSIVKYLSKSTCSICHGRKLNSYVCEMKICGIGIGEAEQLSINELKKWCALVKKSYNNTIYFEQISTLIENIDRRAQQLINLKVAYLSIGRSIPSLSGGELQRVRLASQLNCSLSGLIYILDEPCKGLHYSNIDDIISSLQELVYKGNTVIAIEHNKHFINSAENIIEMGPCGGPLGGYILSEGIGQIGEKYNIKFKQPRKAKKYAEFKGISYRNLNKIGVNIPLGCVTCVSGISGSGKSSLSEIIEQSCIIGENEFCEFVTGIESLKKVIRVNQKPIGKTARSTVVSYLGIYDIIRDIYAQTSDAVKMGLSASDFSMNIPGGRCEYCQGTGKKKIELTYLPDSYIICPKCKGKRFDQKVLSVKYKGYFINDILNKDIHSLLPVFEDVKPVYSMLKCVEEIGMGYISLGQMSMNLSGGEAQRIKLAKYLGMNSKGDNLYILDEPTSGLSEKEIELLIKIINKLADSGETLLIIEHNIEFIAQIADYLIDLGNFAGNIDSSQINEGDVQKVMENDNSSWKQFARNFL